jgi:Uma2 family endonuclease
MSTVRIKKPPALGLASAGILMTPKEFDAVERYDKRYRYELIKGVLVVTPIAGGGETDPNEELGHLLRSYRDQRPQGQALDLTMPQQYVRTRTSRRQADRLIWAGLGRMPDLEKDLPTVAVEFVSSARRDRERDYVIKRREYKKLRIPEYWIIDRFRRTMTVVINVPGEEKEIVLGENDTYSTPRLPGFELPLRRLLAVADQWQKKKTK